MWHESTTQCHANSVRKGWYNLEEQTKAQKLHTEAVEQTYK
jgi:hypothetical protein